MKKLILGTPLSKKATKVMLLGAGELGKEVVIELQRYGVEVIAVDRYENAPAMQVAHRSHVINMLDAQSLRQLIESEKPDFVVPEIEAIATSELLVLESEGVHVVPSARAVNLTMNREGIRRLAAEELGLPTSSYQFADNFEDFKEAVSKIGTPCVVKPIMSSSGKGQSVLKNADQLLSVWEYAQEGGRAGAGKVIVEGFVDFDYEITLLTCRHAGGVTFCAPIGHIQVDGDYRESWQPQAMSDKALKKAQEVAAKVTESLGGLGIFGVELFVKGDNIYFSEVSPRPHDTGMVTLISQNYSEFAIHVKAFMGLPVPEIETKECAASAVLLVEGDSSVMQFSGIEEALSAPGTEIRLFGKPEVKGKRRLGVALATSGSIDSARSKARKVIDSIKVTL